MSSLHRILIFILLCFIALCAGVFISLPHVELSIGSFGLAQKAVTEEPTVLKTSVRFVGDVMLARNVEYLMDTYGYMYPFETLPPCASTTYLVGNFEGAIPKEHVPTKSMQFAFSVRPEYVQGLISSGFSHLGLANNHSYDFGADDFIHTNKVLNEHLVAFGDRDLSERSVTFIQLASTTIAVIGVYAVDTQPSDEDIVSVMAYAQQHSTYQVIFVHWGTEYAPRHNTAQERLANAFVDAGADAIVGHHPHVIQDIGMYKGAPIFYSLGNYIFDQYFSQEVQHGLALDMSVDARQLHFKLEPITSIGSRSRTYPMGPFERDEALDELADKSSALLQQSINEGFVVSAFE